MNPYQSTLTVKVPYILPVESKKTEEMTGRAAGAGTSDTGSTLTAGGCLAEAGVKVNRGCPGQDCPHSTHLG